MLVVAVGAASCSSSAAPRQGAGRDLVLMNVGLATPKVSDDFARAWSSRYEAALAACARQAGFNWYVPAPPEADFFPTVDTATEAFATKHGFGLVPTDYISATQPVDPNQDHVESLGESERASFDSMMDGDSGCMTQARAKADQGGPRLPDPTTLVQDFNARVTAEPRVERLRTRFQSCMAAAGIATDGAGTYSELRAVYSERFKTVDRNNATQLAQFRATETPAAAAAVRCWSGVRADYLPIAEHIAEQLVDAYASSAG